MTHARLSPRSTGFKTDYQDNEQAVNNPVDPVHPVFPSGNPRSEYALVG